MERMERLEMKRIEVLEAIKPICEAFKIEDYDYEVNETGQGEILRIKETRIGCSCNSIRAVVDELVGYIFIARWKDRNMGAFGKQTRNVIRRYWIKEEEEQ